MIRQAEVVTIHCTGPDMLASPLPRPSAGLRLVRLGAALFMAAATITAARAQDQDQSQDQVNMRLDRLEQGLNDVQRQLNAGAPAGGADGTTAAPPAGGNQALNTEVRLSNLESQMRDLTGQLEEVQYGISQIKSRLDKIQADDEVRFHALEHPGQPMPPAAGPADTSGSAASQPAAGPTVDNSGADSSEGGPTPLAPAAGGDSGNLTPSASGTLAPPDAAGAQPPPDASTPPAGGDAPPDQTAAAPAGALPSGSPESQYSYAFDLVRQNNYEGAEAAFKQFLRQNPSDPLDGNAQYWLGETYFARNQFQQAAEIFAQGYVKYPKSEKTPNVLLSLGISLGNLGKKQQACLSFATLERRFPNMHPGIKDLERAEKKRLACGVSASAD